MKNLIFNYLTLIIIIIAIPVFIIQYLKTNPTINIYTYVGLGLLIPSLILFAVARIQLGRSFQALAEANSLVTSGIYKRLRHPIYYFGLTFILGAIIFSQKFILIIVWFAIIFMQRSRMKNEEKILEEKFGEKYLDYKKGTWF